MTKKKKGSRGQEGRQKSRGLHAANCGAASSHEDEGIVSSLARPRFVPEPGAWYYWYVLRTTNPRIIQIRWKQEA